MLKELVLALFKKIDEKEMIKSWKNHLKQKTDIYIKINGVMKGISIKTGAKNSIHVERISDFTKFLRENNISDKTIYSYLKYHFGDGTINGRGTKRLSVKEYKELYQNEIDEMNIEFNKSDLINKAIDRFVLLGKNSKFYIDALVYGTPEDFLFLLKNDIKNIINNNLYSTGVHFGRLAIQSKNRCLNCNETFANDRFCIQVKWYNILDNIIEYKNNKLFDEM